MGMDCGQIDPAVKEKLGEELKYLPPGMCFTRCEYSSISDSVYKCSLAMPDQRVNFSVHFSLLKNDQGDIVVPGQIAKYGSKGWVRGEIASPNRDGLMVVRMILNQGDAVELDVDPTCVVIKQAR